MARVEYVGYVYFLADFPWWPVVVCILLNAVVLWGGGPGQEYVCRAETLVLVGHVLGLSLQGVGWVCFCCSCRMLGSFCWCCLICVLVPLFIARFH